jgi:hypothetical protein
MWGLLIANHLDQSLWSTNQKYWAAVRSNLYYSFLEVYNCVAPFTRHGKLHEFGAEKQISWAKPAHFDLFAVNFTVWSHILSTSSNSKVTVPPASVYTGMKSEVSELWNQNSIALYCLQLCHSSKLLYTRHWPFHIIPSLRLGVNDAWVHNCFKLWPITLKPF